MNKVYTDQFIKMKEIEIDSESDILTDIMNEQNKKTDKNRYFLEYLPQEVLDQYDFNNETSLKLFREACLRLKSPLMQMGGINLNRTTDDIRYYGTKISDPYGKIMGTFDIRDDNVVYSPIFPLVYEERDFGKFANTTYFTTSTFEDIIREQIDKSKRLYVHTGEIRVKYISKYTLEKIGKKQMIEFLTNPDEGKKVYKNSFKF